MFKRKISKKSFASATTVSRSSEITKPNSTSMEVHRLSRESSSGDEICTQRDETMKRGSTSIMKSFSQRLQSTPIKSNSSILNDSNTERRSQEKKKSQSKSSYFNKIVGKCGAVLPPGNASYILSEDQALFSNKLNKLLIDENSAEKFLKSFEEEISNTDKFKTMLVHTQTSEECQVTRGPVQDPLMRLLLNVECLQTDLLDIILGKLASLIMESESQDEDSALVASIIRQLRYLTRVKGKSIAQKLFEIIEMASINIQREIIFAIPEIVSNDEHEVATKHLLELLKFNSALTHVIIDALTNLSLSKTLRSEVREKMLNRLDKCPQEHLPLLVQFIITRCDNDELSQVIDSLRKYMPFTVNHSEMRKSEGKKKAKLADEGSYVKLTFENLKFALMASKQMTDAWIKVIAGITVATEFRCFDLAMLIIIYWSVFDRKSQILSLLRNKIKSLIVTETHIHQSFQVIPTVLTENNEAILEIASSFLKSYDTSVSDFAGVLYETCFVEFNFHLRQNVMSEILAHIGTGVGSSITAALTVLSRLTNNHGSIVKDLTVSVMSLLLKLPELEIEDSRTLLEIISRLVCSSRDQNSALADELEIFIRKMISSSKPEYYKKGIISACIYARYAVGDDEQESDVNLNEINSLLDMACGSSYSCNARRSFFNDEFASQLNELDLRKEFINAWQDRTYRYALDNIFVRKIDFDCEYFPMSVQYALETDDARQYIFPAVDLVKKAHENNSHLLNVAPSFMKLLYSSTENFDKILPLFSASVIMPEESVYEKFDSLTTSEQKLIMDCLFICSNYLVECINALCTKKTKERVLIRLKQLMQLRRLIGKHINKVAEYKPPVCQHRTPMQKIVIKKKTGDGTKPKRGRKRKLDEDVNKSGEQSMLDISRPSTSASISVEIIGHQASPNKEDLTLHNYRGYFRDIHCRVFKLLRMDLKLNPTKVFKKTKLSDAMINEEAWYYKPTEKPDLDAGDLVFLMEEFIFKAECIFKDKRYSALHRGKSTTPAVDLIPPEKFVMGFVSILPKICAKIELLNTYCKDLLEANDGVYDAPGMFPKEAADIKLSLAAAFRVIAELLSWHGFRNSNFKTYLKAILKELAHKGKSQSTQQNSLSSLALEAGAYLSSFAESSLVISGGISIVKAIQCCIDCCQVRTTTQKCTLAKICYDFLRRPWFTVTGASEKGSVFNQQVDFLLKTYFSLVEHKLHAVKSVAEVVLEEHESLTGKESTLETFKTINKLNFPLMYRNLCEALLSGASDALSQVEDDERAIEVWNVILETFLILLEIVKSRPLKINMAAVLKRSGKMIELFLMKGMPVMESALRVKSEEVLGVLKALQNVKKYLHLICCQSKLTGDSTVGNYVPAVRSICEKLMLKVKGMLILNNIPLNLMFISKLQNKDIDGNEIFSQPPQKDDDEEEEDVYESELPPEEEEESSSEEENEGEGEEDGDGDGDVSTQESNSEVY